jgi:LmbE family N-acetylglucosaminyl deacetylase
MPENDTNTLMLVGAHHDDNELMAGTIAKHVKAGWRVVSMVTTDGRHARGTVSEENVKIREQESCDAAELLGMEPVFLRFLEDGFRNTEETCRAVGEQIVKWAPSIIITHPPLDYHFDHMNTSNCVRDATYRCYGYAMAAGKNIKMPRLYYSDAWFVHFDPQIYVDVSDYIDLKGKSLACHISQLPGGEPSEGDMIDHEKVRSRFRGIEAGVKHAEAFRCAPKLAKTYMSELLT